MKDETGPARDTRESVLFYLENILAPASLPCPGEPRLEADRLLRDERFRLLIESAFARGKAARRG
jgi:hypothetical protein